MRRIISIVLSIITCALLLTGCVVNSTSKKEQIKPQVEVILDAKKFITPSGTVNIDELKSILGEPESVDEWNYKSTNKTAKITTLSYKNSEYNFFENKLQRITLYDVNIGTYNKMYLCEMFGLETNNKTKITANNDSAYRAFDCGVHDLWILFDNNFINEVKISYTDIFS